jgi:hypothetical protein
MREEEAIVDRVIYTLCQTEDSEYVARSYTPGNSLATVVQGHLCAWQQPNFEHVDVSLSSDPPLY